MKADDYDLDGAVEAMAQFGLLNGDKDATNEANAAAREVLAALAKLKRYGFSVAVGRNGFGRTDETSSTPLVMTEFAIVRTRWA
jgi:hypothetical protein